MSESRSVRNTISWDEILSAIKKRKKLVLSFFILGSIFFTTIAFILPKKYESKATILPIYSSSSSFGGLSNLAMLAGFNLNTSDELNKILVILNSRTLRERIVKKLNLIPILVDTENIGERNPLYVAEKKLEKISSIYLNKSKGSINISVLFKDPSLAQKIAQAYIDETRQLLNEKSLSVAKFDRIFLEKKLKEEEKKLNQLQKELAKFQEKTKLIDPNSQLKNILDLYLSLLSKRTELLLELNSLSVTLSPSSPKIKNLRKQIMFIDKQIKKLEKDNKFFPSLRKIPEVLTKYSKIMRELKTSQAIYETLTKLYQQARLNESKERLFIEVIDPPTLPDIPAKPKKALIIIGGSVFSLIAGLILAVFLECCRNNKKPEKVTD